MSEWIEINLPWRDYVESNIQYKEFPDLSVRAKTVFGETLEEVKARTIESESGEGKWDRPVFDRFEALSVSIEDTMLAENAGQNKSNVEYKQELRKRLESLNNSDVKKVFEYRDFNNKYNEWLDAQTENIETTEHNLRLQREYKERQRTHGNSFVARGLNRAGTVIEVKSKDGQVNQWMIGDLNELGGVCDDCAGIDSDDLVLRYRTVWKPEE